ncbi:MAG TPA: hypothetical protein VJG13_16165 [Thermoanaerobaculia bacterium]|nr:hypothetical protein [Thermoanaerobaculia bacterium]
MTTWRRTLLLAWAGSAALAAAGQEPPFGGEERVTAVDLLVRMDGGGLRPAELEALVSGVPRPVVALEPPGGPASWRVVLYFDAVLSDEHQMRWAAELLAGRLDEIRALGAVDLVVADPDPRTVVSPEADGATLEEALAQMALFPRGEDALVERRLEILEDLEGIGPADLPTEAGAMILADESALVQERLDALLLALVERSQGAPSRRLVLIASGGFDLAPGWLPPELAAPPSPLAGAVERLGRTLSAYGWLAAPLLAPPPSGTVPGVRVGKWRFGISRGRWRLSTTGEWSPSSSRDSPTASSMRWRSAGPPAVWSSPVRAGSASARPGASPRPEAGAGARELDEALPSGRPPRPRRARSRGSGGPPRR